MNIQRKYSLPNCTLLLEGLSDVTRAAHFQELRPELSILVNAECSISNYQPISGGREFFESLVRAVSAYAQEFLSNIPNPQAHNQETELVELQKINSNCHRLVVHAEMGTNGFAPNSNQQQIIQVDLNTVQLFDLVEAIDQFFADTQTLPELSLELQPVTRRYGGTNQVVIKQAVPAAVGVSSLAAAALAFSLIPAPKVPEPKSASEDQPAIANVTPTPTTTPIVEATPTPTTTPIAEATPTPTTTPIAEATPTPTTTPIAEATPTPTITDLEALLKTVPEITDASQLRALNRLVYNQIHPAWANRSGLQEDLVYRLGVAGDGSIIGFKAINQKANEGLTQTPLPNLLYNPANRRTPNEPIAQFKVVFTKRGVLEVSPWNGYAKTPDVVGEKITDSSTLQDLNKKLYSTVRQGWSIRPTFTKDLKYRVAVNKDGAIADYEALNQLAFDYQKETPLPQLFKAAYDANVDAFKSKQPLGHFQVTFKPNGELEVTPWQGYQ
jgi:hypothetical protein